MATGYYMVPLLQPKDDGGREDYEPSRPTFDWLNAVGAAIVILVPLALFIFTFAL